MTQSFTGKRIAAWLAGVVVLCIGVGLAVPASRYRILAVLRDEPLFRGRPADYWIDALASQDAQLRREAALELGEPEMIQACGANEAQQRRAVGGLLETLGDPEPFVRKCAATSLLGYPRDTVVPVEPATVVSLGVALGDQEVTVRRAAARLLWQAGAAAGSQEGVSRLTTALDDPDDFVREHAARALGRIGPPAKPAVPALLDRLAKDEERDVREHAAKSLGLIGADAIGPLLPKTVKALRQGLHDTAADVRENSARALGQLGAREALDELRSTAKDTSPRVRAAAEEAVCHLTTPDVIVTPGAPENQP
jgi:HEAT repeat protein